MTTDPEVDDEHARFFMFVVHKKFKQLYYVFHAPKPLSQHIDMVGDEDIRYIRN